MTDSNSTGYTPPTSPLYDQTSSTLPDTEYGYVPANPAPTSAPTATSPSDKADTAKQEAASVAGDAQEAAQNVAATAKDQASKVVGEATGQAKDLLGQATSELKEQAAVQQQRAADGLHSISDELSSMADGSGENGLATELVRNLSGRAGSVAGWLDGRDPGSLLDEVKSFAARKPGTFIAIAAGAGILAGRLAKALAADSSSTASTAATAAASAPAPATQATPAPAPEPPFRTQAAFADADEAFGASTAETAPGNEIPFDDLLGDAVIPGRAIGDGEQQ